MAFQKSFEQPSGVVTTYHRILRGIVDFKTGFTTVEWASYLDLQSRTDGKQPIAGGSATFEAMPNWTGDPRPWSYAELKKRPEWADAQDV